MDQRDKVSGSTLFLVLLAGIPGYDVTSEGLRRETRFFGGTGWDSEAAAGRECVIWEGCLIHVTAGLEGTIKDRNACFEIPN